MEIENPGRLPNALTVETMKLPHDSYPMNINIADVLFKTKYLDSWGSGVKRMMDACKEVGACEPEYELRPGGVAVIFKRIKTDDTQIPVGDTQNDTQSLSARQKRIVECIDKDNTLSTNVMAGLVGISVITIKRELKVLGYSWQGPAKTGHWVRE